MNMFIETYRGYNIWQNTRSVNKKNNISRHQWTENVPLKTVYVSGKGASVLTNFITVARAHKEIDLIIKGVRDEQKYTEEVGSVILKDT